MFPERYWTVHCACPECGGNGSVLPHEFGGLEPCGRCQGSGRVTGEVNQYVSAWLAGAQSCQELLARMMDQIESLMADEARERSAGNLELAGSLEVERVTMVAVAAALHDVLSRVVHLPPLAPVKPPKGPRRPRVVG